MADAEAVGQLLLVVEDNAVARAGLAALLRREGYRVELAGNGQEALDYLANSPPPDLILLDMLMPVLDGWHFLERLRRDGPPVPVVVTTGTILTLAWAASHGCQGFVRKPIEPSELFAEVRRCLA